MNLRMRAFSGTRKDISRDSQPAVSEPRFGAPGAPPTLPRPASMNSIMMRASNQGLSPFSRPVTRHFQERRRASVPAGMLNSR